MSHFLDWKSISSEQGNIIVVSFSSLHHPLTVPPLPLHAYASAASLETALSDESLRAILSDALSLSALYNEAKSKVALDYYMDCYLYCKNQAFCARKTSAFISIAVDAFTRDTSNRIPAYTMTRSFEALRNAVLRHSVERPPRR